MMMKMKKIALLFVVVLTVLSLSLAVSAETVYDVSYTMEASASTVDAGEEFTVDIIMDINAGFAYATANVYYDPDMFECISAVVYNETAFVKEDVHVKCNPEMGKISIEIGDQLDLFAPNPVDDKTATGKVATLTFKAKETAYGLHDIKLVFNNGDVISSRGDNKSVVKGDFAGITILNENSVCSFDGEPCVLGPAADCVNDQTCEKCGVIWARKTGHIIITEPGKPATCTTDGLTEGARCKNCNTKDVNDGFIPQRTIPKLGHDIVIDAAKDANCTETGLTAGQHCSRCDECTTLQEIVPAKGHTTVTDAAVAPTCTSTGLTEGSHCDVCQIVFTAQETVPVIGHTIVIDQAVEPTYSSEGKTEGSHCSVCNQIITAQDIIPAKSSAWIWITVIASILVLGGGGFALYWFILRKKY